MENERTKQHWEIINEASIVVSNTPEELWQNACKYFNFCDENPLQRNKKVSVGKDAGKDMREDLARPYTIKGLCLHCGILEDYLESIRKTLDKNDMYYIVVSKILYLIFVQNAEYATVGIFNPVFTSRILGMDKDSEDAPRTARIEVVSAGLPELSSSEQDVLDRVEQESMAKSESGF